MKWCPECDNILIPKDGKLYCKACDKFFELGENQDDYKISKKIKHEDTEVSPVVMSSKKKSSISVDDRKAYEEFFKSGE
jgi:uncharacterized Zn finger protein (UPF0148 family)